MTLFAVVFEFRTDELSIAVLTDSPDRESALIDATTVIAKERQNFGLEHAHVYRVEIDLAARQYIAGKLKEIK